MTIHLKTEFARGSTAPASTFRFHVLLVVSAGGYFLVLISAISNHQDMIDF